jgi:hypothetical protein
MSNEVHESYDVYEEDCFEQFANKTAYKRMNKIYEYATLRENKKGFLKPIFFRILSRIMLRAKMAYMLASHREQQKKNKS